MATIYEIKIRTVSPFVNYDEEEMKKIFEKFLREYRDNKTKLGFENTEIDVKRN